MQDSLFPIEEAEKEKTNCEYKKIRLDAGDRKQTKMVVAALDDLVPEEHEVRVVWKMVEMINTEVLNRKVEAVEGGPGRSAISPKLLYATWLYATLQGVGSARKLAALCRESIPYRWLMGGIEVNYHTLADFRMENEEILDGFLAEGVTLIQKLIPEYRMVRTAQDGIRVRASAGAQSFKKKSKLEEQYDIAKAYVEELKHEMQNENDDAPKTGSPSKRVQAAKERAAREREQKLKRSMDEIEKIKKKQAKDHKKKDERKEPKCSTTDPEARFIHMPAGEVRPCFNGEVCIDTESRLIMAVGVTNTTDFGQMVPMLDQINEKYGRYSDEHLVDGGFPTHEDLQAAYERGVTVYSPLPKLNEEHQDPSQPKDNDLDGVKQWRERMMKDDAQVTYRIRAATIEWANALLRMRGLNQLTVRGMRKARSILLWLALAHNLRQSYNLLTAKGLAV